MTDLLSSQEFLDLFRSFQHTAIRLETRDRYVVEAEQAALARFLAGQKIDPVYEHERAFWDQELVAQSVAAGKRFERVRVVPEPLTAYLRFSLRGAGYLTRAGENINYLGRAQANALDLPAHDFWLLDAERLVLLYFTADDRLLGSQTITEPAAVRQHARWFELAREHATPYRLYLAEDPTRDDPPTGGA